MSHHTESDKPQAGRDLRRAERERILRFFHDRGVREVRVFGSVARGEDGGHSDIDLLIELPDSLSVGAELLTVLGFSEELSALLGVQVDVVSERTLRPDVRDSAIGEAVPL